MKPATVLVVDDHPLVREGLCSALGGARDITLVGEAGDGLEAEQKARELKPDVVLLDISLPHRDGIETARAIHCLLPDTKIVMLTAWADPDKLIQAIAAGASGYILKDRPPDYIIAAVRSALAGDPPIAGALALETLRMLGRPVVTGEAPTVLAQLSVRQREVLRLLGQGLTNKEIAASLSISSQTVANHLKAIYSTLGVRSRAGAAWVYLRGESSAD